MEKRYIQTDEHLAHTEDEGICEDLYHVYVVFLGEDTTPKLTEAILEVKKGRAGTGYFLVYAEGGRYRQFDFVRPWTCFNRLLLERGYTDLNKTEFETYLDGQPL